MNMLRNQRKRCFLRSSVCAHNRPAVKRFTATFTRGIAAYMKSTFEVHPPTKRWESCLLKCVVFNACLNTEVKINQLLGTAEGSSAPCAVEKKVTQLGSLHATNIYSSIEHHEEENTTHINTLCFVLWC